MNPQVRSMSVPISAPINIARIERTLRPLRAPAPRANGESAARPVMVICIVVVTSATASLRTIAFRSPIAIAVSAGINPCATDQEGGIAWPNPTMAAPARSTASAAAAIASCCAGGRVLRLVEPSSDECASRECRQRDQRALDRQLLDSGNRKTHEHDVACHVRREDVSQPDEAHRIDHAGGHREDHQEPEQIRLCRLVSSCRDSTPLIFRAPSSSPNETAINGPPAAAGKHERARHERVEASELRVGTARCRLKSSAVTIVDATRNAAMRVHAPMAKEQSPDELTQCCERREQGRERKSMVDRVMEQWPLASRHQVHASLRRPCASHGVWRRPRPRRSAASGDRLPTTGSPLPVESTRRMRLVRVTCWLDGIPAAPNGRNSRSAHETVPRKIMADAGSFGTDLGMLAQAPPATDRAS